MESYQTAVVVVISLLAGAAMLVLMQLSIALRGTRAALERTALRAHRAIDAIATTAERLDRVTGGLDEARVRTLMESFDSVLRTVSQLRESTRVAAAVGAAAAPAIGAAVKAWRAGSAEGGAVAQHRDADAELNGRGETR